MHGILRPQITSGCVLSTSHKVAKCGILFIKLLSFLLRGVRWRARRPPDVDIVVSRGVRLFVVQYIVVEDTLEGTLSPLVERSLMVPGPLLEKATTIFHVNQPTNVTEASRYSMLECAACSVFRY
jgi:hypothetical protein